MQTINIVHPNDPRGTGSPLTIIARKLNRIEAIKRSIEVKKQERPSTDEVTGAVHWRRPGTSGDPRDSLFWLGSIQGIASGWLNPPDDEDGKPAAFSADNLILLFDEKYDVLDYTGMVNGKPVPFGSVTFPFFVAMEWGNPERWPNPTQGGSKTT